MLRNVISRNTKTPFKKTQTVLDASVFLTVLSFCQQILILASAAKNALLFSSKMKGLISISMI